MTRIEWNAPGERLFEAGVDRGVLYPRVGPGVPWNGLISVSEQVSGGEAEALYFNGVKYADIVAAEDFKATLEAFAAPQAFAVSDGMKQLAPGLIATQQPRKTFGLCYRTLIGNDLVAQELGYKLHLVYNATASPSSRSHETIAGTPNPSRRTWEINTVPPPASTFRPTAHIVLDTTLLPPGAIETVEAVLYGSETAAPYLPTIAELVGYVS